MSEQYLPASFSLVHQLLARNSVKAMTFHISYTLPLSCHSLSLFVVVYVASPTHITRPNGNSKVVSNAELNKNGIAVL